MHERKRKKGKLPEHATSDLKEWWFENIAWPYPSVRLLNSSIPEFLVSTRRPCGSAGYREARAERRDRAGRYPDQQLVHQPAQAPLAQGARCGAPPAHKTPCCHDTAATRAPVRSYSKMARPMTADARRRSLSSDSGAWRTYHITRSR